MASDGKTKRGLPSSFHISVPQSVASGPVDLGEYLDEPPPPPRVARPATPAHEPESRIVTFPRAEPPVESPAPPRVSRPMAPPHPVREEAAPPVLHDFLPGKKQSRKQVNMNPETLQMVDELIDQICTQCVQSDVKGSELFHALVSTLYEAREYLDFSQVKPRGKWGSPTAKAFPVSLKNAFRTAIAERLRFNRQ